MAAIAAALCTAPGLRPVPRGGTARAAAATVPLRPLLASAALQAHAPRRPSSGDLACRAEQGAEGGGSSEPENLESLSFQSLASLVVTNIASAYQGHDISGSKLAKWLAEVSSEGVKKGAEAAGQAAQEGGGGVGGALKKAAHVAASALGARQEPREPWEAAAHYLGADALSLTPDALTSWITSPKRKDDAKVVGALLMKMLQYFEKQTGESWEGKDHQYSFLWHLTQELFGGSMSMRLVKTLVQAYFRAPTTL